MGLFDRAKKVLQGRPIAGPARAESYRVACPEGHVLHGSRTDGYQALRCPECDAGIFVLPRSPLPEPVPPKSGAPARRRAEPAMADELVLADPPSPAEIARARTEHAASRGHPVAEPEPAPADVEPEAEIEWVDEVEDGATSEPPPAEVRPRKAKPRPSAPAKKAAPMAPETEPVPAGMIAVEERPTFAEWAGRHKNPLIFTAVILIVVATVAMRLRQRRIEDLPRVVEIGRIQGMTRLDDGDFVAAKQILAEAASAVKGLGGQVEGAEEILQAAREAALFADLSGEPLGDLVEEAAKYNPPDAWPAHFDALYKGRSLIFTAEVVGVPDPDRAGSGYEIDQPIYYGNGPAPAGRGRLDLAGFGLLEQARPNLHDVVTFGARLEAIRFDAGRSEWVVTLAPDSGAFITHAKALAHLPGWDQDGQDAPPEGP